MSLSPAVGMRRRRRIPLLTALIGAVALITSPLMLASPAAADTASEITLASAEVSVGDSIAVSFATDRPSAKNWVAIYAASTPEPCDACGMAWAYAPGASGSVQLPTNDRAGNPLPAGSYRVEYLYNDGYTRISEPKSFTIAGEPGGGYEGPEVDPTKPIDLSVVQLNVWGKTTDAQMLEEIGADLIFVEEAQRAAAAVAEELGFDHHSTGGSAGVISRYPIVDAGVVTVPGTQGGWVKAIVQVGDTQIAAYGGHLEYRYYATYLPRGYAGDVLAPGFPSEWRGWSKLNAPVTDVPQILAANEASSRPAAATALINDMTQERAAGRLTLMGADMNEPSDLDWTESTANLYDHNGVVAPWQTTSILRDGGLVDAYRAVYPNPVTHPGFTWPAATPNVSVSQLAWAPEADERDRIDYLFFAPDERLSLTSTRIVGPVGDIVRGARALPVSDEEIFTPQTLWTSDHKGLQAEFVVCGEACRAAQEPGELTVGTPSISGTPKIGATVTAETGEWTAGTAFAFQWLADGEPIDGATAATFTIPPELAGRALSVRVGGTLEGYLSAEAISAAVTVADDEPVASEPTVTISAKSVIAGGTLRVTGSGFAAGAELLLELHSTPVALGTATASAAGEFSTIVRIPGSTSAGAHTLVVMLPDETQLRLAVTVTAAQGAGADGLAQTGSDLPLPAVWMALMALALGGLLLARRRMRQH
ncbi:LPXTG cell wall anchor domain-containing protein [Microbacterium paraoxydans]|uniref:LPXTG cell wall anchor domain-containing protein n=1 Tax=Microbacterium paraoxydans TaxID=199592 RepID=UPI001CF93DA0|nr:LPXTG cell wall anchor domain-containing protein [Microbacterium paraoxydans]